MTDNFSPADMATAAAQGFRDGVASLAASAGGPVVNRATVIEWLDANDIEVTDRQLGGLFNFSAPPTAQAEGWMDIATAPKDGTRVLLVIDHGEHGDKVWTGLWANGWMVSYGKAASQPTHWMTLPPPPTSAEGVEHE